MRTTLSIDDDVLAVVQERARRERRTAGQVLSDLAREALSRSPHEPVVERHGFPVLPPRGQPVSNALVEGLRDEDGV
ncbi:MAG: antitoxin [Austwickia sp.]|jgi:hypothetical protein|nr:antitoxin [Austwickia sp.]MBK8437523.1 antitoxin [Austwickia sp.]MBK9102789.1 antitoxin [Austwickia sp.]